MPENPVGGSAPHPDQEEVDRDLLAYIAIRIRSRTVPTPPSDIEWEEEHLSKLTDRGDGPTDRDDGPPPLALDLERRIIELLVPRLGIPIKVKVFTRRGSIELGILILGSYALLKDYKPLRDSLGQLRDDIKALLGVPASFIVEEADFRIPGASDPSDPEASGSQVRESAGGLIGMGLASRYAVLYLLILNVLALIFFCYLTLTAVMANM